MIKDSTQICQITRKAMIIEMTMRAALRSFCLELEELLPDDPEDNPNALEC